MKTLAKLICFASLLSFSLFIQANEFKPKIDFNQGNQFFVSMGLQMGGDELQRVVDVNTGETSEKMRAGGYYFMQFGHIFDIHENFTVQTGIGFLRDAIRSNIDDARSTFHRKPVELIAFYNKDHYRIGLGYTRHLDPKWTLTLGSGEHARFEFDDSDGAILQADYRYNENLAVGIKFTIIEYEAPPYEAVDGDSAGVHLTFTF